MRLEHLERGLLAAQQVAAVSRAAGMKTREGGEVEMPSWTDAVAEFDDYLASEPKVLTERERQLRAVGVG